MIHGIALIMNFVSLLTIGLLMVEDRPSFNQPAELAVVILFTLTPLITLIALVSRSNSTKTKETWLSLYLRRKRLEEEKRIRDLGGSA